MVSVNDDGKGRRKTWGVRNRNHPSLKSRRGTVTCTEIVAKLKGIIHPANRGLFFFQQKTTVNG